MDSKRDEKSEYSSIEYDHLVVEQKSTNLTPKSQLRSSEGNTYAEPSSAVNKRKQKMFEAGETLPLVKNKEKKHQKSRESTICSIKCGLLILFILLTSALSLLFCLHYLEVVNLPVRGSSSPYKTRKTRETAAAQTQESNDAIIQLKINAEILLPTINEQRRIISETIDRHVADLIQLKSNASTLMRKLNEQNAEIDKLKSSATESNLKVSMCLGNITKLKDSSTELQRTIDDQKKKMELQAADINTLTNNVSILMDTINEQKKTISEKEAVIASRGGDVNRIINNINQLAPEHTSVMLLGGLHENITNSTTIYNSMEKSWKSCKLTLPNRLVRHGAAILSNEIYIFGGYDGGTYSTLNSLYKLGAGNKWERMADMNEKRQSISQSSVVFNSEIWVIGGHNGTNNLKSVEKYNPKTNKWTKMPELKKSRTNAAATVANEKIYVSAGWDGWNPMNSVEVYDPEKRKWEIFTPNMPYAVDSHILIRNHSHLIAIDRDFSRHESKNRVWKIDVSDPKREWKKMPYLRQGRDHSGAAIIADGLMVFGGLINSATLTDSVEIFDGVE